MIPGTLSVGDVITIVETTRLVDATVTKVRAHKGIFLYSIYLGHNHTGLVASDYEYAFRKGAPIPAEMLADIPFE
jgi:hypothetical protein